MDQNWNGGPVRPSTGSSWQGPQQRNSGSFPRFQNQNPRHYNYHTPTQGGWNFRPPSRPYYRNQNQFTHRGRGGSFNHAPFRAQSQRPPLDTSDINNWISPEMWQDPWEALMQQFEPRKQLEDRTASFPDGNEQDNAIDGLHYPTTTLEPVEMNEEPRETSKEVAKGQSNSPGNTEPQEATVTPSSNSVTYETLETFPD